MKTRTKALVLTLCAALLVVTTVFATMAFLTSSDDVVNTFTVGKVGISLDEADVDGYGSMITRSDGSNVDRVQANEYKLIPGHSYVKDPTVHVNADSEGCWLFVKLENGLKDIVADTTIEDQIVANGWVLIDADANIYAYSNVAYANDDVVVFESFTLTDDAAVDRYADAEIVVTAYAVQRDGFNTYADAWNGTFAA